MEIVLNLVQNRADFSPMLTAKDCLEVIQQRAQQQWGKRWLTRITEVYVELMQQQGDETATFVTRRSQVRRAFEQGSCSTETLFLLAESVGCEFQMVCTETTVIQ